MINTFEDKIILTQLNFRQVIRVKDAVACNFLTQMSMFIFFVEFLLLPLGCAFYVLKNISI